MAETERRLGLTGMYRWAWDRLKPYRACVALSLGLMFVAVALNLLEVEFIKRLIDAALARNLSGITFVLVVFLVLVFVKIVRNIAYGKVSFHVNQNVHKDLKNEFVSVVMRTGVRQSEGLSSGELVSRHDNDLSTLMDFVSRSYTDLLFKPVMAVAAFVYLLTMNWKLAIVLVVSLPALTVLLNRLSQRAGSIWQARLKLMEQLSQNIKDSVDGREVVRTYNLFGCFLDRTKAICRAILDEDLRQSRNDAITVGFILAVDYLPRVLLLIHGGYLVVQGELSLAELIAFNQLVDMVSTPTTDAFSTLRDLRIAAKVIQGLGDIYGLEPERRNGAAFPIDASPVIRFADVRFGYEGKDEVLKGVSFAVERNECVGVAGASGAGKSTILSLMCGFCEPVQGDVFLFGERIQDWSLEAIRGHYGYIGQDGYLFSASVMENIRYGDLSAGSDEVRAAAAKAHAHDFVMNLPEQYETMLGEKGAGLSGGERQRIAIARAFLRDAPVLLLDEPTSALDARSEALVQEALSEIVKGRTTMITSHRLSSLRLCDRVLVLQNGAICECGTHVELMRLKGAYHALFSDQEQHTAETKDAVP
ncbi:MAG: ABC transporter ATP-binding protein [Anaerolineae bacterium]